MFAIPLRKYSFGSSHRTWQGSTFPIIHISPETQVNVSVMVVFNGDIVFKFMSSVLLLYGVYGGCFFNMAVLKAF